MSPQGYSKSAAIGPPPDRRPRPHDLGRQDGGSDESELMRESKGAGAFRSFDDVQALATAMSMDHATVAASFGVS